VVPRRRRPAGRRRLVWRLRRGVRGRAHPEPCGTARSEPSGGVTTAFYFPIIKSCPMVFCLAAQQPASAVFGQQWHSWRALLPSRQPPPAPCPRSSRRPCPGARGAQRWHSYRMWRARMVTDPATRGRFRSLSIFHRAPLFSVDESRLAVFLAAFGPGSGFRPRRVAVTRRGAATDPGTAAAAGRGTPRGTQTRTTHHGRDFLPVWLAGLSSTGAGLALRPGPSRGANPPAPLPDPCAGPSNLFLQRIYNESVWAIDLGIPECVPRGCDGTRRR
jgi:hypothetical protein